MSLRALIIDDEQHNVENLRILLERNCPQVSVMGTAQDAGTGLAKIHEHQPDLIFLDVEMPGQNGLQLLESIGDVRGFEVIFVTAFHQYAIEALRLSALDYLLKPIRLEELKRAVEKVSQKQVQDKQQGRLENMLENLQRQDQEKKIAIASADRIDFVRLSDILYCKSDSNYTSFFLQGGRKITASQTLKSYERVLREFDFLRIHQSYLINLSYVSSILKKEGGHVLMSNGDSLPISRSKKEALLSSMADR